VASETLYEKLILEHSRHPRNFGKLSNPSVEAAVDNPVCGDKITLQLEIQNNVIQDVRFHGQGCAICLSVASVMTETIKGDGLSTAIRRFERFRCLLQGSDNNVTESDDLSAFKGVRKFPVRIKCALLPWHALRQCLEGHADS